MCVNDLVNCARQHASALEHVQIAKVFEQNLVFDSIMPTKQVFPNHGNYLLEAFRYATTKHYCYLLIDCHQLTPKDMCLKDNIFPENGNLLM
jgi:hypothetical protein